MTENVKYYQTVIPNGEKMETSTVTKKGQVTIPLRLRKLLNLRTGEKVVFDLEGEKVVLKKASCNPIDDMIGLGVGIFEKGVEYQRKIRAEWEET
ncbi:MAG: AbrB/MazE/SpoVT family DNA-binding domain-containing protein [Thermoplasmata archaeon]|nr:MAG: AbrB/MazE/SpoVT family DNA-binding domain-containing protein [Thermoplasmata archaeon]